MIDDYTVATEKNFEKAVNSVLGAIKKRGLRVLHVHDISGMLASAGFSIEPLSIVEFCRRELCQRAFAHGRENESHDALQDKRIREGWENLHQCLATSSDGRFLSRAYACSRAGGRTEPEHCRGS